LTIQVFATDDDKLRAFRALCAEKFDAAQKANVMTVIGEDGWLFFDRELHHLSVARFWGEQAAKVSAAKKPENADPLPVIVDFAHQLKRANVELILLPVPAKAAIYPDRLAGTNAVDPNFRVDSADKQFYELLKAQNVNVLDLTDAFKAHRDASDGALFCKQDTHWSGQGCLVAARVLAEEVKMRPWAKDLATTKFESESRSIEIDGDLRKALNDSKLPKESLRLRFVGTREGNALKPIATDANSPILLLGDSHNLIFSAGGEDMQAQGAGFPDQLAMDLGIAVDVIAVRGSGATPARVNLLRAARSRPNYLAGKKLIIWCFGAREFTESDGWQKVPIVK
jgi:alginate O-acetyltransferase complex protein AlgJ